MNRLIVSIILLGSFHGFGFAGITILPIRVELIGEPGQTIEGNYEIINQNDERLRITVNSRDYFVLEENRKIKYEDWFTLFSNELDLEGNEKKGLKYKIKVPESAKGFLMCLNGFITLKRDDSGNVAEQMLKTQHSIPVYVRIKGTESPAFQIEGAQITGKSTQPNIDVKIKNTGNTYLRPGGIVEVYRGKGVTNSKNLVGNILIKEGWPVFPNQTELYKGIPGDSQMNLKRGKYTAVVKMWCEEPRVIKGSKAYVFVVKGDGSIEAK